MVDLASLSPPAPAAPAAVETSSRTLTNVASVAGLASMIPGPVGTVAGLVEAGAHAAQGKWGEATWAGGAAVAGMVGAAGIVKGIKVLKASKEAGAFWKVGGHHIHAKRAFQGVMGYNEKEAFAVSSDFLAAHRVQHADITGAQQQLFRALAVSGAPNTFTHHSRIAYQSLVKAGMPPSVAKRLVIESQKRLISSGVVEPARIPWAGQ